MLGMPGELWILPVACIVLGALSAIVLAFGGEHVLAVVTGLGISGGGFGLCMWAFRGRPPRWALNRITSLWFGSSFETRPTSRPPRHPYL